MGRSLLFWLFGCLGIEPRLAILQVNHKLVRRAGEAYAPVGGGECGTCHDFASTLGPGICPTTEENHGKTSVRAKDPEESQSYDYIHFLFDFNILSTGDSYYAKMQHKSFLCKTFMPIFKLSKMWPEFVHVRTLNCRKHFY